MSLRIHTDMTNMRICTIHGNKRIFTVLHLGIQFAPLAGSRKYLHFFALYFYENPEAIFNFRAVLPRENQVRPFTIFEPCFQEKAEAIYTVFYVLPLGIR